MTRARPAESDNPPLESADCHQLHANSHSGDKAPKRAPLFHFEQVRGRGDAEILRLARLQHGQLLRSQLSEAGIGRGALAHRLATGWLCEVFPAVYRLGGADQDRLGQAMAAALSFRGHALVSGPDASMLWAMLDTTQQPRARAPIHVLLVARNSRPRPGITIHRAIALARQDMRWRDGIPVSSPARTLLDLAGQMDELDLESVLAAAFRKNLVRRSQLADVMDRNPGVKGIARLRSLLDQTACLRDTRSEYERRYLELLRAAELPLPLTNTWVAGKLVDGLWPDLKLVLEIDGYGVHGGRDKFESDRVRDQRLLIADNHVIRVTARQIDHAPYALVARTASVITTLRLKGQPSPAAGLS